MLPAGNPAPEALQATNEVESYGHHGFGRRQLEDLLATGATTQATQIMTTPRELENHHRKNVDFPIKDGDSFHSFL